MKDTLKKWFMKLALVSLIVGVWGLGWLSASQAWAGGAQKFQLVQSREVSAWLKDKAHPVYVFDANSDYTRKSKGVVPGAKLLSSYKNYDISKELPLAKDSRLVFYCMNEKCTASHSAAEKAVDAGYTQVNVMSDGIQGWLKSGFSAAKP